MQIQDDWELVDGVSGLKLKVFPGTTLDRLHIESMKRTDGGMPEMNRDIWFGKDGRVVGELSEARVLLPRPCSPRAGFLGGEGY